MSVVFTSAHLVVSGAQLGYPRWWSTLARHWEPSQEDRQARESTVVAQAESERAARPAQPWTAAQAALPLHNCLLPFSRCIAREL